MVASWRIAWLALAWFAPPTRLSAESRWCSRSANKVIKKTSTAQMNVISGRRSSIAMLRSLFIVVPRREAPRTAVLFELIRTWRARALADQCEVPDSLAQDISEHRAMGETLERLDKSYDFDLRAAILWRRSR
jgi:hypothetical protein